MSDLVRRSIAIALLSLFPLAALCAPPDLEIVAEGPSGGAGGESFCQGCSFDSAKFNRARLSRIRICDGDVLHSVQLFWRSPEKPDVEFWTARRGGDGGRCSDWTLRPTQYITKISGHYGSDPAAVISIRFFTNDGKTYSWGGEPRENSIMYGYDAPPGYRINGFIGRSGDVLDAIGVVLVRNLLLKLPPIEEH